MSLILDALNRSRQDADPVPGIATHHPVEHIAADRRGYLPWIALAVALLLIVGLLVDRIISVPAPGAEIGAPVAELSQNIGSAVTSVTNELKARAAVSEQAAKPEPTPQPAAEAISPNPEVSEPVAATMAEPVSASAPELVASPVAEPVAEPVAQAVPQPVSQPVQQQEPQAPAVTPGQAAATEQSEPETSPKAADDAAVAQLYQNRDVEEEEPVARPQKSKSAAARSERTIDVEQILTEAREEVENASLSDHPAPFLADLSQQIKDSVPTLYYHRHEYSNTASQSRVILNGEAIKVGGSPMPGMTVDEILPDSVVLTYKGTQFRLRALNSWINL